MRVNPFLFYQSGKTFCLLHQRLGFAFERLLENSVSMNFVKLVLICTLLPVTVMYFIVNINYLIRLEKKCVL